MLIYFHIEFLLIIYTASNSIATLQLFQQRPQFWKLRRRNIHQRQGKGQKIRNNQNQNNIDAILMRALAEIGKIGITNKEMRAKQTDQSGDGGILPLRQAVKDQDIHNCRSLLLTCSTNNCNFK